MDTKEKIEQTLRKTLTIHSLDIIDESHRHARHKEAQQSGKGHFNITVVSHDFKNVPRIKRHRMIQDALKEEFQTLIHALSIKALTPQEIS